MDSLFRARQFLVSLHSFNGGHCHHSVGSRKWVTFKLNTVLGVWVFLRFDLPRSPQNLFQLVTKLVWLHNVENKPFYINLPTQPIKLDSKWSLWQQNCCCLTLYAPTQIWWDHSSTLRLIIWTLSSLNKKKTFKLFYYIKDITIIKSIFTLTWNLIISQTFK